MQTLVPNKFPTKPSSRRLAVVGESPGSDETNWHVCQRCGYGYSPLKSYSGTKCPACGGLGVHTPSPFVGPSGLLLNKLLAEVGIEREACFVGNSCQVQPPRNEIKHFAWDGVEIQSGLDALSRELAAYQPHFCLLLGSTALRALKGDLKANVSDWRGSLFLASAIAKGVKSMAAYHPAALLRDYSLTAVTRFDFKRAKQELMVDGLELPKREVVIAHPDNGWTPERIRDWCLTQRQLGTLLAVDIEGVVDYVECIGFATGSAFALVVPFISVAGESIWNEEDEYVIWTELEQLLQAPEVPKVLQNSLYDCFVLAWSYGIVVRPVADDTMLKHHELYCELEKSLAFQTSLYTRQSFYKFQRKHAKAMQEAADL